jgi:Cu(I)/Ag(I) efflux system membrane protein CusA/SilA
MAPSLQALGAFAALFMGLIPIMYSTTTGADVMKRVAAPLLGGVASALILVLLVFPAIFAFWRGRGLPGGDSTPTGRA